MSALPWSLNGNLRKISEGDGISEHSDKQHRYTEDIEASEVLDDSSNHSYTARLNMNEFEIKYKKADDYKCTF